MEFDEFITYVFDRITEDAVENPMSFRRLSELTGRPYDTVVKSMLLVIEELRADEEWLRRYLEMKAKLQLAHIFASDTCEVVFSDFKRDISVELGRRIIRAVESAAV